MGACLLTQRETGIASARVTSFLRVFPAPSGSQLWLWHASASWLQSHFLMGVIAEGDYISFLSSLLPTLFLCVFLVLWMPQIIVHWTSVHKTLSLIPEISLTGVFLWKTVCLLTQRETLHGNVRRGNP
ncbi:hypothetical protein DRN50_08350 [Thermococci archaeon]|nr:MAG: hypothetical protein DRN50_08350 [Thermococci archaeon]